MIEARHLSKRYGATQAVDDVSLRIEAGASLGLLGPNGAGKTTTIHLLCGVLAPDAGEVLVGGQADPRRPAVRRKIGIAPQGLAIYEELTAAENLRLFGALYGLSGRELRGRVDWALDFAGLAERRGARAATFSGGMKRRLNLAAALVHRPSVLVCDEPTVGIDPQSRNHVFECIEALQAAGTTLLYTTHYMEEAARLCERVAIMDHGRILALDSVEALITRHGGPSRVAAKLERDHVGEPPACLARFQARWIAPDELAIESERPFEAVAALGQSGLAIRELKVERPGLEHVFLRLTGRSLRDA